MLAWIFDECREGKRPVGANTPRLCRASSLIPRQLAAGYLIDEKLAPEYQVIYTTHSPFMIDSLKLNLTTGSVPKKLIMFALPLLFANLLQSFYSVADMLIVGNIVGETGLAAISNASMISIIINSICIGVTMGGTVLIAQYKGANDEQGQIETVGTLFVISFVTSLIVTIAIGIGSANIAMVNALLGAVFVRLSISWILAFAVNMGFSGVYIGQAVSPILPAVVGLLYFKNKAWEMIKLIHHAEIGARL